MNPLNRAIEMLQNRKLTDAEGERMAFLLACGPWDEFTSADDYLIDLGLAEKTNEGDDVFTIDASPLARRYFYEDNGSVRAPFRWW